MEARHCLYSARPRVFPRSTGALGQPMVLAWLVAGPCVHWHRMGWARERGRGFGSLKENTARRPVPIGFQCSLLPTSGERPTSTGTAAGRNHVQGYAADYSKHLRRTYLNNFRLVVLATRRVFHLPSFIAQSERLRRLLCRLISIYRYCIHR